MDLPQHIVSINGVPRSGTSWLGQIMNSSPRVAFRFQPLFSYAHKGALKDDSTPEEVMKFYADILHTKDDFVLQRDPNIHVGYPVFAKDPRPSHLIYKNVRYHYLLPGLLEKIPSLVVVGIVRHPCAVIHSWSQAPREFKPEWDLLTEWNDAALKNAGRREEYFGYRRWKEVAEMFLQLARQHPRRMIVVKYTDLHQDPVGVARSIFERIELPFGPTTEEFIADSRSRSVVDPNSVHRAGHDDRAWIGRLPPSIVSTILADLKGSSLEEFADGH